MQAPVYFYVHSLTLPSPYLSHSIALLQDITAIQDMAGPALEAQSTLTKSRKSLTNRKRRKITAIVVTSGEETPVKIVNCLTNISKWNHKEHCNKGDGATKEKKTWAKN